MSYPRISCHLDSLSSFTESGWHETLILLLLPSDTYYCGWQVLQSPNWAQNFNSSCGSQRKSIKNYAQEQFYLLLHFKRRHTIIGFIPSVKLYMHYMFVEEIILSGYSKMTHIKSPATHYELSPSSFPMTKLQFMAEMTPKAPLFWQILVQSHEN